MKLSPTVSDSIEQPNRREFLARGAALAVLPTIGALSARAGALELPRTDGAAPRRRGMLGYWASSEALPDLEGAVNNALFHHAVPPGVVDDDPAVQPFAADVLCAEDLPSGDPRFLDTGVRIGIHGLGPPASSEHRAPVQCVRIDVPLGLWGDDGSPLEWCAWSHQDDGGCGNTSSPVVATIPVHADGMCRLTLSHRSGEASEVRAACGLNPGVGRGQAKLRRGLYFLHIPAGTAPRVPNWRRLQWRVRREASGTAPGLVERRLLSGRLMAAEFDYVVISVDHGVPESRHHDPNADSFPNQPGG